MKLDEEERAAMDAILEAHRRILALGLRANQVELAAAVHVLQGFIVQHMLSRVAPEDWAGWYEEKK